MREQAMIQPRHRASVPSVRDGSSQAGFTLVEALIAVVILAVGLMAVTNLFVVGAASNQVGNYSTATASVASETLEKIQALDFFFVCPQLGAPQPVQPCPGPVRGSLTANVGPVNNTPEVTVGGVLTFHSVRNIPGIGNVRTRWVIQDATGITAAYMIIVQSRIDGPLGGSISQAQFTGFRACTAPGCS